MIAYLSGTVQAVQSTRLIVLVGGVGYAVSAPTRLLAGLAVGNTIELSIYTHVREDALELFGFSSSGDQVLFERLISVSGVGPRLALAIMSHLSGSEIQQAIAAQDVALLTTVSGVGKKTAQRIVIDLKDAAAELLLDDAVSANSDALQALLALGYSQAESRAAVQQLDPSQSVEDQIKQALKQL